MSNIILFMTLANMVFGVHMVALLLKFKHSYHNRLALAALTCIAPLALWALMKGFIWDTFAIGINVIIFACLISKSAFLQDNRTAREKMLDPEGPNFQIGRPEALARRK